MGCFDRAKVGELFDTCILNELKDTFQELSDGLHRNDGLAVVKSLSGPEIERMKKRVIKTLKNYGLKITIKGNVRIVNFPYVTFNLYKNNYKPYRKSDNHPVYINVNSSHPLTVVRELPKSIGKRLSELLCYKKIFEKNYHLKPPPCKIIWFSLLYSVNV